MLYNSIAQSFVFALLSSLWQCALLLAAAWLVTSSFRGLSAKTRHDVLTAMLGGAVLWFAATWYGQAVKLEEAVVRVTPLNGAGTATYSVITPAETNGVYLPEGMLRMFLSRTDIILAVYLAGLLLMCGRFLFSAWQITQLKSGAALATPPGWQQKLEEWCDQFAINRRVLLLVTNKVNIPSMVGILRPVILIPASLMTTMPADQLEAILLHELAHIRRNDFLINLLQSLAETMFFFNPFVWLLSARIREERELCCDDLVVEHLNPLPYARALARLPEAAANGRLVLAATGNKKKLFNRIKRIIEMKKQNSMNGRWGLLAATLLVAVSVAVFTPSFAQKRKKKQASSTTTYVYKYITADSTGKLSRVKTITGNNPVTTVTTVDLPDDGTDGNSSRKSKTIVISKSGAATAIAEADDSLSFNLASLGKELESLDLGDLQLKLDDVDRDLNNLNIQVKGKKKHATISISASINDDGEEAIADVRKTTKGLTTKTMTIAMNGGKKALTVSDNSGFDDMISDLEKEGLLDRKGNFNISSEKGELYINGVKQAKNVTARYKLDGDAKINISGNRRNLSVSIEK